MRTRQASYIWVFEVTRIAARSGGAKSHYYAETPDERDWLMEQLTTATHVIQFKVYRVHKAWGKWKGNEEGGR